MKKEKIRLIFSTDWHGHHDEVAKMLPAITAEVKGNEENSIFLYGGDVFSPNCLISAEIPECDSKILAEFVKHFTNYAYMVPGNHDFIPEESYFKKIGETGMQFIASNVEFNQKGYLYKNAKKLERLEINGITIALFGLVTPESANSVNHKQTIDRFYTFDETCRTLQSEIEKLKKATLNQIIILSHLGLKDDMNLADFLSEQAIGDILICGGHSHKKTEGLCVVTKEKGSTVTISNAGAYAEGYYQITINNDVGAESYSRLSGSFVETKSLKEKDKAILSIISDARSKISPKYSQFDINLDLRDESMVIIDPKSNPIIGADHPDDALASTRYADTYITRLTTDAIKCFVENTLHLADIIALFPGGGIRANYDGKEQISYGDIIETFYLDNRIKVIEVSGENIIQGLYSGLFSNYHCVHGRMCLLIPSENLEYSYNVALTPGNSITEIKVNNKYIDPKKNYTIATTDYIAARCFPNGNELASEKINTLIAQFVLQYLHEKPQLMVKETVGLRIQAAPSYQEQLKIQFKYPNRADGRIDPKNIQLNIESHMQNFQKQNVNLTALASLSITKSAPELYIETSENKHFTNS